MFFIFVFFRNALRCLIIWLNCLKWLSFGVLFWLSITLFWIIIELVLKQLNKIIASSLNIKIGSCMNYPIKQKVRTVADFIANYIPITICVLKQTICIKFIFIWTEVEERVVSKIIKSRCILIIFNDNILKRKLFQSLFWVFTEEIIKKHRKLIFYSFIYWHPMSYFLFTLLDSFKVFLIVIYFLVIFPEAFSIFLNLIYSLSW